MLLWLAAVATGLSPAAATEDVPADAVACPVFRYHPGADAAGDGGAVVCAARCDSSGR